MTAGSSRTAITVVTVCRNAEATIEDAVCSVRSQAWAHREHLIIDGMSQDDTVAIARAYGDGSLRVISEHDRGIYDAMNKGIKQAKGEIIGFLNADDWYCDARVLGDIANAFRDERVDAVFGNLDYVSSDGSRVMRRWRSRPYTDGAFGRGWLPPHPTFFVRSRCFSRLGHFDLSYRTAADFDLMNRFFTRGHIRSVHLPRTLVCMRAGGVSNASWQAVIRAQLENMRSLIGTFGVVPPAYPILKLADRLRQIYRARSRRRSLP
jgi:glycosyltransferase involved in cell wall biosynthesis